MHTADINRGAPAPIAPFRPLDPAGWLARYVDLGGGYTVRPNGVILHWSLGITEEERRALVQHERPLRRDLIMREAVKAYLASYTTTEADPC
ncbi:hypothetical protein FHS54_001453 [Sphingobium vermicomposti]|uniref:Uncharacterized protein n=1 Tax=Sphingobium vermicomposti TaxID=529005 RepID=A0A846M2T6_9SPHN|nr:hypothetical protein [Sphingobium vermicomposti]